MATNLHVPAKITVDRSWTHRALEEVLESVVSSTMAAGILNDARSVWPTRELPEDPVELRAFVQQTLRRALERTIGVEDSREIVADMLRILGLVSLTERFDSGIRRRPEESGPAPCPGPTSEHASPADALAPRNTMPAEHVPPLVSIVSAAADAAHLAAPFSDVAAASLVADADAMRDMLEHVAAPVHIVVLDCRVPSRGVRDAAEALVRSGAHDPLAQARVVIWGTREETLTALSGLMVPRTWRRCEAPRAEELVRVCVGLATRLL